MLPDLTSILLEGGATAILAGAVLLVRRDIRGVHDHLARLEAWLASHGRRLDRFGERIAWLEGTGGRQLPEPHDPEDGPE